ncbi:hypothetical protein MPSEU_000563500 [Mayamaea pseudoterrestris]|nr:hypothetical protein MPSEU_000563500 [Mayamaea pseudoterrestris]
MDQAAAARRRQRSRTPYTTGALTAASTSSNEAITHDSNKHETTSISTLHVRTDRAVNPTRLTRENSEAAEEAASILASVRKSGQKIQQPQQQRHNAASYRYGAVKTEEHTTETIITPNKLGLNECSTNETFYTAKAGESSFSITKGRETETSMKVDAPKLSAATQQYTANAESKMNKTSSSATDRWQKGQEGTNILPRTNAAVGVNKIPIALNGTNSSVRSQTDTHAPPPRSSTPLFPLVLTSLAQRQRQQKQDTPSTLSPLQATLAYGFDHRKTLAADEANNSNLVVATTTDNVTVDDYEEAVDSTAEDLEPLLLDAVIDASCFQTKDTIMLRSKVLPNTMQVPKALPIATTANADGESLPIEATGPGLGRANEAWTLMVIGDQAISSPLLRYGDTISLRSVTSHLFLGVRPIEDAGTIYFQAGCFRASPGKAERWRVLRAFTRGRPVRVGTAGVEAPATRRLTAPVRPGDGVVLRSCQMGGVISVQANGQILIVTDSYDSNQIRHGRPEEATLLGRLQRHSKLVPSDCETMHLLHAVTPPLPNWVLERPEANLKYLGEIRPYLHVDNSQQIGLEDECMKCDAETLAGMHAKELAQPNAQEYLVIPELLGSFMGLEGQFVQGKSETDKLTFRLVDSAEFTFDTGIRSVVNQLLPLSTYFVELQDFVTSHLNHRYGKVMHAFCDKIDTSLQDYLVYICTLNDLYPGSGKMLRDLQVDLLPTLQTMTLLHEAIQVVRDTSGGSLLNALQSAMDQFNGNVVAERIVHELLNCAATPYLHMLSRWIEYGELDDPFGEFLVRRSDNDALREKYFVVASQALDHFFTTASSINKVIDTGRYWSMVKPDEKEHRYANTTPLRYSSDTTAVLAYIEASYQKASELLVHLLVHEIDLIAILRLMRRYFLLDQGDFFVNFMDAAEAELLMGVDLLSRGQIEHWFNTSVQLTEHGEFELANRDYDSSRNFSLSPSKFRCCFVRDSLIDAIDKQCTKTGGQQTLEPPTPLQHAYGDMVATGLTGVDSFVISLHQIPFPASLVLDSQSMSHYQLLFRHLFFAKRVERRLVGIWQDHQALKELQSPSMRSLIGPTFLLRARMLHFVQTLIYYLVVEVIDTNWAEMEQIIRTPNTRKHQTIDDIVAVHQNFLSKTLEASLLTNMDLLRALTTILNTCLMFSKQMDRFMGSTSINEDKRKVATEKRHSMQRTLNYRDKTRASLTRQRLQETTKEERVERKKRLHEQSMRVYSEIKSPSYRAMMDRFDDVFSQQVFKFMAGLKHTDLDADIPRAMNLALRLDFKRCAQSLDIDTGSSDELCQMQS